MLQDIQYFLQTVLDKLKNDPMSITPDDARRLHEHFGADDARMARLISAVETTAAAHNDLVEITQQDIPSLAASSHASIHTIAQDLLVAIDKCPSDVNAEVLTMGQRAVSNMQKVLGKKTAPHPELEAELQAEYARIKNKVEAGTVTKAEANHLHSLEARAHGHTEPGGLTAKAQSVATRRERTASLSDASNGQSTANKGQGQGISPQEQSHRDREANLRKVEFALRDKVEHDPDHVTKEDAALLVSRERRAHNVVEKDSLAAHAQSLADKHANLEHAKEHVSDKPAEQIKKNDAAELQSREARLHGSVESGSMAAEVQSKADKNVNQSAGGQSAVAA